MTRMSLLFAKIAGHLHLWRLAVLAYAVGANSFGKMKGSVAHLHYVLMMCRESSLARNLVAKLIYQELDQSAENNLWLARMSWVLGKPELALLILKRTERLFPGHVAAKTASSLRRFAEAALSGAMTAQLESAMEHAQLPAVRSRPIVVTMVSWRLWDIFHIWLSQAQRHTSGYLLIFALDQKSAEALRNMPNCGVVDVSSWFDFDQAGRLDSFSIKNLWVLRVLALRVLVQRNYDVASLDLDAIMVGNLDEMLESFPATDIVAQMDYSIPMDVARQFGFILCCGFLVLRSNDRVAKFLDEYSKRTTLEIDDQLAINHLLADNGISDKVQTGRFTTFRSMGLSWLCPAPSLVSREISSGSVVRHFLLKDLTANAVREALGLQKEDSSDVPLTKELAGR